MKPHNYKKLLIEGIFNKSKLSCDLYIKKFIYDKFDKAEKKHTEELKRIDYHVSKEEKRKYQLSAAMYLYDAKIEAVNSAYRDVNSSMNPESCKKRIVEIGEALFKKAKKTQKEYNSIKSK